MFRNVVRSALVIALATASAVSAQQAAPKTTPKAVPKAAPASMAKKIPTPESVFGFPVGAEHKLFDYKQSIEYFRKLAAASPNVRLINVGKTSFGQPWTAVIISSPANLIKLGYYQGINQRLAHPEGLTDSAAHALAREGKAFVDISGGLHASEIAGSQHTPQLAYELLANPNASDSKQILDNVIFFLWPSINPDGQDIVVENCRAREAGNAQPMELYQKYVGHDNNRDSYMMNVVESRVIQRIWREWEPDIIYVHHQSPPPPYRIWLPPFADPVGQHAPPIPAREINMLGMAIAQELDSHEQPGAVHALATFDAWYPGYIDYMGVYQNIPSWWTETQGGNCANTQPAGATPRDLIPQALYLSQWPGKAWGLRDAVDYMVTASMATLKYAAKYKDDLLYNRYQSGRDVIQKYRTSAPYAYIIPQQQNDPMAPVELLRRMAFHGLHVKQLDREMPLGAVTYPKGTWVIPMDQEFGELVRELFEPQKYPTGADDSPYDAAGWTLPFQMGVNVIEDSVPLTPEFRAAMKPIVGKPVDWRTAPDDPFTTNAQAAGIVPASFGLTGSGDGVLLDPAQNNSFRLINRALAVGGAVKFVPTSGSTGARYLVSGVAAAKLDSLAKELYVTAERTSSASVASAIVAPTRVAVYKASPGNMDEGWTEWLFDTHGYKYTLITPADLAAGNLGARFDAVVFGTQGVGGGGGRGGRGGGGGRGGAAGGAAPAPDAATTSVDEFIRGGGTAIFWNGGTNSAISTFQLPVRNVVAGLPRGADGGAAYFTGGSIMRVTTDPTHPVMSGMPTLADVMVYGSPVFTTTAGFEGSVLAKYSATDSPLRSGFLKGPDYMKGYAAALDVKRDKGHIILTAFQPEWRGQPMGSFRIIFNAVLYARAVSENAHGAAGFWTAPK